MEPTSDAWEAAFAAEQPSLVRPYTLTAGRTATEIELPGLTDEARRLLAEPEVAPAGLGARDRVVVLAQRQVARAVQEVAATRARGRRPGPGGGSAPGPGSRGPSRPAPGRPRPRRS